MTDIDVPELIDAVVGRLRTEDELSDAGITDGPELTGAGGDDWVLVGFDGDQDGEFLAATTEESWAGLDSSRRRSIQLTVALLTRRGDGDVQAARARVYEMARVVRRVLRDDPSVGLPGAQCAIGATALHQPQNDSGLQTRLLLTLVCQTI
ncbi:hypothetical protein RI578_06455 [Streptomyces sp. BB1-1-1]|uniref:hypothetical protein n=1 Tax=Streptomyces sp. BB1-1-1 TaxID=3074430 RepID=UPI00287754B1|nr:hypothetical protein [Streptomyces sp. BB1-1-1]WND33954.1 hypothetical protein RI578_06455 [Streptomyces sp. BB1-1-1]